MKPFYFYHLISTDVVLDENGILSPQFMYDIGRFADFDKCVNKYRERLVSGWGLYPDKKPEDLTRSEIVKGINEFRKSEDGLAKIYAFRYSPYRGMGKNMDRAIMNKTVLRLDLNQLIADKLVKEVDWGYWMSRSDNTPLDRGYYEKVSTEEYFKNFDDDNSPVFASLNHIGVITYTKCIPLIYLCSFDVPGNMSESVRLESR